MEIFAVPKIYILTAATKEKYNSSIHCPQHSTTSATYHKLVVVWAFWCRYFMWKHATNARLINGSPAIGECQNAYLSIMNMPQPKSSFGSHLVSAASPQGKQIVANKQPVLPVWSTSDSSISKNTGGIQRRQ